MTIHLVDVTARPIKNPPEKFPYTVPSLRGFESLTFNSAVTFFVGENGSGKSTLLEAFACAIGSITVGSESVRTDPSLAAVREYGDTLKLSWNKARVKKGFFMRAEDFFGYARGVEKMKEDMRRELEAIDQEYANRPAAKGLAAMPFGRELADIQRRYGEGLDAASHGEGFFKLFNNRFVPGGLYLLDEPEAPLSPIRQLAFLSLMKEAVTLNAQFIIATHSPILMAYPDAAIYSFDERPVKSVEYESLEHVTITRAFLNNPQQFLKEL